MQIVFQIHKQFSISANLQPNSKVSGYFREGNALRSLYEELCKFFLNKLRKYGGASSFKLLETIVFDSMSINSLIVFHPRFSIN